VRDTLHAPHAQAPARDVLRRIDPQPESAHHAAERLRAATRHYEQHVIAWHALGRLSEARAARDDIARYRQKLGAQLHQISNTPIGPSAATSHHDTRRGVTDTPSDEPHGPPPTVEELPRRDFRAVMT
jgi:hypothetical protein